MMLLLSTTYWIDPAMIQLEVFLLHQLTMRSFPYRHSASWRRGSDATCLWPPVPLMLDPRCTAFIASWITARLSNVVTQWDKFDRIQLIMNSCNHIVSMLSHGQVCSFYQETVCHKLFFKNSKILCCSRTKKFALWLCYWGLPEISHGIFFHHRYR